MPLQIFTKGLHPERISFLFMKEVFKKSLENNLEKLTAKQQKNIKKELSRAVTSALLDVFCILPQRKITESKAAYLSAEFLPGNFITSSLAILDLVKETKTVLHQKGFNFELLTDVKDPALGNGGLGRLASCLLESAAATNISLDGYGIRYRYGIFKQEINNFEQTETADLWQDFSTLEKEHRDDAVKVSFGDFAVLAVPFDIPIVGKNKINRLRLWQSEAINPVDFNAFSKGDFSGSFEEKNKAQAISAFLYPPDDTAQGKELRLKQQYFFSAASVASILKDFAKTKRPINELSKYIKIQLNDTHPTIAIPELIRILSWLLKFQAKFFRTQTTPLWQKLLNVGTKLCSVKFCPRFILMWLCLTTI